MHAKSIRKRNEAVAEGRTLRSVCPRSSHAQLAQRAAEYDVARVLVRDGAGRLADLLPIRHGRMAKTPFAFFRGALAVMADDLAALPSSGIPTQLCGDCHLTNFSGLLGADGALLFGINDFDETCRGPFEWDVKRLAASFAVFAVGEKLSASHVRQIGGIVARAYRERLAAFAEMRTSDIWMARLEAKLLLDLIVSRPLRKEIQKNLDTENRREHQADAGGLVRFEKRKPRIVDQHAEIYHLPAVRHFESRVVRFVREYRDSLPAERRLLVERYSLVDVAAKVTGIGSVGNRCAIALLIDDADEVVLLQIKEARRATLERHMKRKRHENNGLRVVMGQHQLRAGADQFLGWFRSTELGRDFHVRRYKDTGFELKLEGSSAAAMDTYARVCGWELARAHARAGDAARISGYLGNSRVFDDAIDRFALAYAQRNLDDHGQFVRAITEGRIPAVPDER